MSKILGKWLDADAKQVVLQSKLIAMCRGVLAFSTTAASSDVVTTEVEAAANIDTPQTALTAKGIYTGAVSGTTDGKKVIVRAAGTDNGINDGNSDEVFAKLSEAVGVFTLSYFKSDNTAFTFSGVTSIDFYFVEIQDLDDLNVEALLTNKVTGVIDAGQAATLGGHLDGTASKHDATEVDYERTDGSKKNISGASDDVEASLTDLDDAIGALDATPTNYTPTSAAIVADHLAAIDGALATVAQSDFDDSTFRISDNGDSSKKIAFEASGITTSTVRTITAADRNVNLDNVTDTIQEKLTLIAGDITSKFIDLANIPKDALVQVMPKGGIPQISGDDYTIITDGTDLKRLSWSALGMDGILAIGDVLFIQYEVDA